MAVDTYTKSGSKAQTPTKLDKEIFGVNVAGHQLLADAYLSHLANTRTNNAVAKKRGEVRGGGRKPWRQKGTGNARFGSSRNPIWRGGGAAFGPTGSENYRRQLSLAAKQSALRQALSLAAKENRLKVIDSFTLADGKTSAAAKLLKKIDTSGQTAIVLAANDPMVQRATKNLPAVKVVSVNYLGIADVMDADCLVFEKTALDLLKQRLGGKK